MSNDPDDELFASLQDLANQTSAAAGTLRRRVTSTDAPTPTPTPGTGRISLASHRAPPVGARTPTAPGVHRISLAGSAHVRPVASAAPASPAVGPSWAQNGRDVRTHAARALATRLPGALTAMTSVTAASGSSPLVKISLEPSRRPSPNALVPMHAASTALAIRTPSIQPASATWAAAVSYGGSLILLAIASAAQVAIRDRVVVACVGAGLLYQVLRFVWLHRVWRVLPAAELVDGSGSPVTPAGAVGRHFIPFYNFYWVFAARSIVCRALGSEAASAGLAADSPRVLGAVGALVELIPYANWFVGPFFNVLFMARVDVVVDRIRRARNP